MFCTECGAQIPDDAAFCTNCGASTAVANEKDPSTPTADSAFSADAVPGNTVPNAQTPDFTQPLYGSSVQQQPTAQQQPTESQPPFVPSEPPRRKRSRRPIIAVVILCVVLLAAGGLAAYHFLGPGLPLPWLANESSDTHEEEDANTEQDANKEDEEKETSDDKDESDTQDNESTDEETAQKDLQNNSSGDSASDSTSSAQQGMAAVSSTEASSTLAGDNVTSYYGPDNLIDGDLGTGWAEGVDGPGVGQWFQINFSTPQEVFGVALCPGYAKSQKLFEQNGCPTRVRVSLSDGASMEMTLQDSLTSGTEMQAASFENTHLTSYVRVEILEVRPGSYYDDTVISEFNIY